MRWIPWHCKPRPEPTNVVPIGIEQGERLRRIIRSKHKARDYTEGRFPFWYVFVIDGRSYTLSSVELLPILER